MKLVDFDFKRSRKQHELITSPARIRLFVAGRRAGKTHAGSLAIIAGALEKPDGFSWVVGPSYPILKTAERKFFEVCPRELIRYHNKSSREVQLINGHTFEFRSVSDPDEGRGPSLDQCLIDEAAVVKREAYRVLLAALADRRGRVILTTTPRGFSNWVYDVFKDSNTCSIQATSFDNPFIDKTDLHQLAADYDEDFYNQEVEGKFVNVNVGAVYHFDRARHVRECPYDPNIQAYIGQDFNVNPMWSVVVQVHGDEVWVVDEVIGKDTDIIEHSELLKRRGYGKAIVICDPSGANRMHSGKGAAYLMKDAGFQVWWKHAKSKDDKINAVRALLKNARGETRLFFDPKCKRTIECHERLAYKENGNIDKTGGWDHGCDAVQEPVNWLKPINQPGFKIG